MGTSHPTRAVLTADAPRSSYPSGRAWSFTYQSKVQCKSPAPPRCFETGLARPILETSGSRGSWHCRQCSGGLKVMTTYHVCSASLYIVSKHTNCRARLPGQVPARCSWWAVLLILIHRLGKYLKYLDVSDYVNLSHLLWIFNFSWRSRVLMVDIIIEWCTRRLSSTSWLSLFTRQLGTQAPWIVHWKSFQDTRSWNWGCCWLLKHCCEAFSSFSLLTCDKVLPTEKQSLIHWKATGS